MQEKPVKTIDFSQVIKKLKTEGSAQGFRTLRDFLLVNFSTLKKDFTPLGLMNLVVAVDKHAIFADMSSEKSKEQEHLRWRVFQDYLNGKVESFSLPGEEEDEDGDSGSEEGSETGEHADPN